MIFFKMSSIYLDATQWNVKQTVTSLQINEMITGLCITVEF